MNKINNKVPAILLKEKNKLYVICGFCHYIMQEGNKSMIIIHPKTCPVCNSLLDWDNTKDKL